jgi:hypothetical protein
VKIRQRLTGQEFTAVLVWPKDLGDPWVEVEGIGLMAPLGMDITHATPDALSTLPAPWFALVVEAGR